MSAKKRTAARRLLVQAFYQTQLTGHSREVVESQLVGTPEFERADKDYFLLLLGEIANSRDELDAVLELHGDISPARLDPVEHAILWVAVAELMFHDDVPRNVVINEAIELSKLFGAEGGYRFVNGVLDKAATGIGPAAVNG